MIGGGCYGSWYTQQLLKARVSGALLVNEIVVVDRNPACRVIRARDNGEFADVPLRVVTQLWAGFLTEWLAVGDEALAGQALVPSPLMPHLLLDWLVSRAAQRWPERTISVETLQHAPRIPWERAAPDGRHYVSFAEWMCPINCIEPALCPATGDRAAGVCRPQFAHTLTRNRPRVALMDRCYSTAFIGRTASV